MEAKFTKGPWAIKPLENNKEYIRIRGTVLGGKFKIANVIDLKDHHDGSEWCKRDRDESMANANLIAAAPEMYEELQELSNWLNSQLGMGDWHNEIEKLLAKARGEL